MIVGTKEINQHGSHNVIIGDTNRLSSYVGIVAGYENNISGVHASVTGGYNNTASDEYISVTDGYLNEAIIKGSVVFSGGGWRNTTSSFSTQANSGQDNTASSLYSSVSDSWINTASSDTSPASGRFTNKVEGYIITVTRGRYNTVSDKLSMAGIP